MTDMDRMFNDEPDKVYNFNDYDDLDVPDFLKKDRTVMDKKELNEFVKNSTTGTRSSFKPVKKKKVNKQRVKKGLVTLCCACMIFGAVAFQGAKNLIKGVSDTFEVSSVTSDFREDYIFTNSYHVGYEGKFAFNYDKIAEHIKTDEDVYLCYRGMVDYYHFGEDYANEVFKYVDGVESLDNFLETRNYKDKDEWIKVSNEQILMKKDIQDKQDKVSKMVEGHEDKLSIANSQKTELGGK